jgi:iron complex outermembrane recepter protein
MKQGCRRRSIELTNKQSFGSKTKLGAAVFFALYGLPPDGLAQQSVSSPPEQLEEVIVTATRRNETLEAVPYNISVISADQIGQANITDIASLTEQVPGLSTYNYGARYVAATAPNIRGINATGTPRGFRTFEQDPVGTYIGNSPIDGYYQLDDIKQVEVLRGPQGTLYGAGALGGAIRIIPNSPELNVFNGSIEVGGGKVVNAADPSFAGDAVINIPIGETLAFRASGKYAYDPGFIDVFGLLKRSNNGLLGVPVLADPGDPVNSSPIYSSREDWNWQRTTTARASVLWKPVAEFSAELADLYSTVNGDGGPTVNFDYPGGVSPFDPHTTLPPGGHYQEFSQIDQPFSRHTNLGSVDMSFDAGFATLSATSSYHTTSGLTLSDQSYNVAGQGGGNILAYYAGIPTNPRFVYDFTFGDSEHTFTQEIRLVSKERAAGVLDYVIGLFYEDQYRNGVWNVGNPGSPERSVAQGCTAPVYDGATYPNCLLTSGVNDLTFIQNDTQKFEDKSVFGELTWHFLQNGQITFGARHFYQDFTDAQLYLDFTFPTLVPATPHSSTASKTVGKVNPSYEYAKDQFVYALWSQGFRRGGANSVPYAGFFAENPYFRFYQPDSTNNYEAGLKGRFAERLAYTFAVYDIQWKNPQISASLPSGNLAVYNAKSAESKGFEFSTSGPLGPEGWNYELSYEYIDAILTSSYSLAANNGAGVITPNSVVGIAGTQLPGSPKNSVSATVSYTHSLTTNYNLLLSLNGSYHSLITFDYAATPGFSAQVRKSSSFETMNFNAGVDHQSWSVIGYITNLLNRQNILVPPSQPDQVGGLTNDYTVSRPREVGLRLGYRF